MAHILIAEDDASLRQFLKTSLERAGHVTTLCADGLIAHDYIRDSSQHYDLLLTDIIMPGMDGIELAGHAARLRPHLPVLYITGFGMVSPRVPHQAQVLAKPLHLSHLLAEIDRHLTAAKPVT